MSPRAAVVVLLLGSPLACSTSPGGPVLRQLGVHARGPGASEHAVACVTLPTLLGSHVDTRKAVDGRFEVSIDATRAEAIVRFENGGSEVAPSVSVSADQIHSGYSEEITVELSSGDEYAVRLSSECGEGNG